MSKKHSPLPWNIRIDGRDIETSDNRFIGTTRTTQIHPFEEAANAALIVKAVNAHEHLTYAFELFRCFVERSGLGNVMVYDQSLNKVKLGDVFGPSDSQAMKAALSAVSKMDVRGQS